MKQDTINVTITADASPAIREIREAERAVTRMHARMLGDPPLAYWRGVRAGLRFARAMEQIKRTLRASR